MSALGLHDPDALIRHRGLRVALGMTAMFALGLLVLDNDEVALFGSFGAFAMLAFADFGGRPWPRTRAYLVLAAVGAVLVPLGTTASEHIVVAAVLLAVVTFLILFAAVFGGYFAAGSSAALLVFVVAVMIPAPPSEIPGREVGWLVAGALSIVIASVLWPVHEQEQLRRAVAAIAERLAAVVPRGAPPDPATADELRAMVDELRAAYSRQTVRPAGPTRHDQALVRLLDEIQRAVSFTIRLAPIADAGGNDEPDGDVDDAELAAAVAATFAHLAAALRRTGDLDLAVGLEAVRDRHRIALEAWVADALAAGRPAPEVAERLSRTFALRVLSHTAVSCDADAVLAMGATLPPAAAGMLLDTPAGNDATATLDRAWTILRPQLRPGSVAFRNAARAALALSAALVVADTIRAEHGFWVVLGALTVLKSSALRTGITAAQALGGNVIGFVVAAAVLAVAGDRPTVLWVLLPFLVFLAAYAPAAVHFVVGQAAFALLVVVLFNLIDPQGWHTGLVRVESVAIGAAVSLVIGVLLWPRGNRRALRAATADLYRSVATYVGASLAAITRPGPERATAMEGARAGAGAAQLRADVALFDLLGGPRPADVPVGAWVRLTGIGRSLRLAGDGIRALPLRGYPALVSGAGVQVDLDRLATGSVERIAALGAGIEGAPPAAATPAASIDLAALLAATDAGDADEVSRSIGIVWTAEWLQFIEVLVGLDAEPVATVAASAATPWWR